MLFDECVNPRPSIAFPGDAVKPSRKMRWRPLTNGRLMKEAAPIANKCSEVFHEGVTGGNMGIRFSAVLDTSMVCSPHWRRKCLTQPRYWQP